jgi:3-dehydroquinate dehydratase-2
MLSVREPDIYGVKNLSAIALECGEHAGKLGFTIDFRQSNLEGELVTMIQDAHGACAGVIINGGAYSHTSIAIHDALRILDVPIIEVHISNTHKRESFRHHSYIAQAAHGVICGFGSHGYILALDAMHGLLGK